MGILNARDPSGRLVWPWPAALVALAVAVQRGAGLPIATAAGHAVVTVLVWVLVRRTATRYGTALVAGTLFAVHPVMIGKVATPLSMTAYAVALVACIAVALAVAAIAARGRTGARLAVVVTLAAAAALAAWTLTLGR